MKLMDILFENYTKDIYSDSIKKHLAPYIASCSDDGKDSSFITVKVKNERGISVGEFKRFITNSTLNKTHDCSGDLQSIVDKHDMDFARRHKLRITGTQTRI